MSAPRRPVDPVVGVRIMTLIMVAASGILASYVLGAQLLIERAHARHLMRARIAVEQPR